MASRIKVDEVTNLAQSGAVSFPTGGASFNGNVSVTGNIDFTGNLLQNGSPFVTLPQMDVNNIGAVLRSGGTTGVAYWDVSGEGSQVGASQAKYKAGFDISRGYTCCGYRGGNSWRNVNRLVHATFTQTNLGDLSNWSGAYIDGKPSTNMNGYIFATGNSWDATSSQVSRLNMATESNGGAAASMSSSRNRCTSMCRDFVYAYVHGGGSNSSNTVRYNLSTEASNNSTSHPNGSQNNPAGGQGATVGWIRQSGARAFNFSTESYYNWPDSPGTDGSNKTLCSRNGFSYWNTSGGYRTSSDFHVRDSYTGGRLANVSKNGITTGEESMHTGNEFGFICGQYDGNQNNNGYLFRYSSHTFQRDSRMDSLGTSGRASAAGVEFGTLMYGYTGM